MKRMVPAAVVTAVFVSAIGLFSHAGADDGPSWNLQKAAASMDGRLAWWTTWPSAARDHGTFCVSCHTALPYALARGTIRAVLHERTFPPAEVRLLDNVATRVRMWNEVAPFYPDQKNGLPKTSESRGAEAILNATILATRDAQDGSLSADARTAFTNLWALQMKTGELTGAWAWLNFRYEPWEAPGSPYFGASLAALAVGTAPGAYAQGPDVQENISLLKKYLAKQFDQQSLHNRLMALWASTRLPGVLTVEQADLVAADLVGRQQSDGGWTASSLGSYQRSDGTPLDTASDGYATGLATLILETSGRANAQVQRGLLWLRAHQDKDSGRWSAFSLNKKRDPGSDPGQFMNDAATAYAALALATASH